MVALLRLVRVAVGGPADVADEIVPRAQDSSTEPAGGLLLHLRAPVHLSAHGCGLIRLDVFKYTYQICNNSGETRETVLSIFDLFSHGV